MHRCYIARHTSVQNISILQYWTNQAGQESSRFWSCKPIFINSKVNDNREYICDSMVFFGGNPLNLVHKDISNLYFAKPSFLPHNVLELIGFAFVACNNTNAACFSFCSRTSAHLLMRWNYSDWLTLNRIIIVLMLHHIQVNFRFFGAFGCHAV